MALNADYPCQGLIEINLMLRDYPKNSCSLKSFPVIVGLGLNC